MAIIDGSTVIPGELELLTAWSSAQRWCLGAGRVPDLAKADGPCRQRSDMSCCAGAAGPLMAGESDSIRSGTAQARSRSCDATPMPGTP